MERETRIEYVLIDGEVYTLDTSEGWSEAQAALLDSGEVEADIWATVDPNREGCRTGRRLILGGAR